MTVEQKIRALAEQAARHAPPDAQREQNTEATWPLLCDLLERPELLAPPQPVLSRLAWRGRTTLLVGGDKVGKSTMAGHAAKAVTRGSWWLGSRVQQGRVVVCAPDEAIGDTVRRLHEIGSDPVRLRLLLVRPPNLLESLRTLVAEWKPDLVVVDSLAEWARITRGTAPEDGDAAGWGSVIRPLVELSHSTGCALLILHHPRRADDQYRGSLEIAAAVDCLLEMTRPKPGEDAAVRRIRGRARWPIEDFAVALRESGYELVGGAELSLDVRVLIYVEKNPGASRRAVREAMGVRASAVDAALSRLEARGAIVDRGSGHRSSLYAANLAQVEMEVTP